MNILDKILSKRRLNILGINSGTSADGIDLALIRFEVSGRRAITTSINGAERPYSSGIKTKLEIFLRDDIKKAEELARLDIAFGHLIGRTARDWLNDSGRRADLIGAHGQTVGHFPKKKSTLGVKCGTTIQIGDGNAIAHETGLPVVSDFRRADIAGGGEGAPLTPFVNQILFGQAKRSRIIINIGGIANYSYHPAGGDLDSVRGADCGPGNILSDIACRLLCNRKYDRDGKIAAAGQPLKKVITIIEKANRSRRVSAGREQFDQNLLARIMHAAGGPAANRPDIMASIMAATAQLIYKAIKPHLADERIEGVFLTGGGRKNLYLVEYLQNLIRPARVQPIEALGYDGGLLEAVSFAVLAGCFVKGISSILPQITGGEAGGVAGKLSLPPVK